MLYYSLNFIFEICKASWSCFMIAMLSFIPLRLFIISGFFSLYCFSLLSSFFFESVFEIFVFHVKGFLKWLMILGLLFVFKSEAIRNWWWHQKAGQACLLGRDLVVYLGKTSRSHSIRCFLLNWSSYPEKNFPFSWLPLF